MAKRTLLFWLLGLLVLGGSGPLVRAEEELTPAERQRRVDAAKKKLLEEERAFIEQVNEAIDRGWDWLRSKQLPDGTFPIYHLQNDPQNLGRQALILYTLLTCGSRAKSKEMKDGLGGLASWEQKVAQPGWGMRTYSAAMLILLHDALEKPPPRKKRPGSRGKPKKAKPCKYSKATAKKIRALVDWLVSKQEQQVWRYPKGSGGSEDLSHGQLVLLALNAAGRCGIEAPAEVYTKALSYLLEHQDASGPETRLWIENPAYEPGIEDRYGPFLPGPKVQARGWSYLPLPPTQSARTGSMTTAGVASLAIIKERLMALEALERETSGEIDRAMLCGLGWLGRKFSVTENPGQNGWHYYYLYGLERVGALAGVRHIGQHDWYRTGAEYLLAEQRPEGGWPSASGGDTADHEDEVLQTCFALLFLKRATPPPAAPLGPAITGD